MPVRKVINDPVHGFITVNDNLIWSIINHPYFQRLRRIKQMAMAHLVYPGAVHTRFAHSLGAYHLMCNALDELKQKGASINSEEEQAAKIAILLHDIGHGPFSHALEKTLVNIHHEEISLLLMNQLNIHFEGQLTLAIKIFTGDTEKTFLHQLVSSQLDVDRLDYLARDSFYSGVSEGVIGYDRIIKMLCIHNNELAVEEKGIHSIEKFIIARRLMYWQVYLHKAVVSSEQLLLNVLKRAKALSQLGRKLFASDALNLFLQKNLNLGDFESNLEYLEAFTQIDDDDIMCAIKTWAKFDDKILSDLSNRILNRDLFKTVVMDEESLSLYTEKENELMEKLNLTNDEISYYLITNTISNQAYDSNDEEINIMFKDGSIKEIGSMMHSLLSANVNTAVKKYYLCFPKF
jgi:uncharacterized protein